MAGLGATPWTVATGKDDPERAWDVLVSTKGDALNDTYAYAAGGGDGWNETVRGKLITRAVYPSIERDGVGGSATAWFDFGNSLDMGRAVDLEYAGRYHLPHESVKLHVFRVAKDELLPCPDVHARVSIRIAVSRRVGRERTSRHPDGDDDAARTPRGSAPVGVRGPRRPRLAVQTQRHRARDGVGRVATQRERPGRETQVPEQLPGETHGRVYPVWQPDAASDLDAPGIDEPVPRRSRGATSRSASRTRKSTISPPSSANRKV